MDFKKVWVITKKQKSKGYYTGESYGRVMPRFTKEITRAEQFLTKAEAEKFISNKIKVFKADLKRDENELENIKIANTMKFKDTSELSKYISSNTSHRLRNEWNYRNGYLNRDGKTPTFEEYVKIEIDSVTTAITNDIEQEKNRIALYEKELFVNEVEMGIRFNKRAIQTVEFQKNENNVFCVRCGADIPNVMYFKSNWSGMICPCCMKEMLPEINKIIKETPEEIFKMWETERFLLNV